MRLPTDLYGLNSAIGAQEWQRALVLLTEAAEARQELDDISSSG